MAKVNTYLNLNPDKRGAHSENPGARPACLFFRHYRHVTAAVSAGRKVNVKPLLVGVLGWYPHGFNVRHTGRRQTSDTEYDVSS